jgi:hypothetical protein
MTAGVALAAIVTLGWAADAEAQDFNTRADNHFVMGPNVQLSHNKSFDLHEGNRVCPGANTYPNYVYQSQTKSFCYEARGLIGPGTHDTELSFGYGICIPVSGGCADSGYEFVGHVLIRDAGSEDNIVRCGVERVNQSLPVKHFDCQLSSVRDLRRSRDPSLTWKLTYTPTPVGAPSVYFVGDSVTAGFGYCGTEGGRDSADLTCRTNEPFANSWTGENSLSACKPPETVNDRCSDNNYLGTPWNAGPWVADPNAPSVAYSYVIAREQKGADPALIYNWAMTGSTPADWDPMTGGRFGNQLKQIKDGYVVMTMGANPLLSYYLRISVIGLPIIQDGKCSGSTVIHTVHNRIHGFFAAPLDGKLHEGKPGVLRCFDEQWAELRQAAHLRDVYETLIANGNHVLVVGYPAGCPWSFGDWQPDANFFDGPAKGHPCTDQKKRVWDGTGEVSQWDQAKALTAQANSRIEDAVTSAAKTAPGKLRFVLPDQGAWAQHQAWNGSPWVFKNDTWVHPNAEGHKQLAATVIKAMCSFFGHWCGTPPKWTS